MHSMLVLICLHACLGHSTENLKALQIGGEGGKRVTWRCSFSLQGPLSWI